MSRDQLLAAALALPLADRAALAVELLRTIDGEPEDDAADAWDAEIDRRSERLDRGETTGRPAHEVLVRADSDQ
jgi:hypothetical protein